MFALIDTNIFLCLAFEDPGWEYCGKLLDDVYFGKIKCVISSIQLSELYTPFMRAGDEKGLKGLKEELERLKVKVRATDKNVAILSSKYRSIIKTPENKWLPLADSIILATAKLENVDVLYTLDTNFYNVKEVKVSAPFMSLKEWIKKFGTKQQKRLLGFT
nr:type II toxin-antitoxin system VapC family toxin [Candidatus Baldrarchaeota archaeon]